MKSLSLASPHIIAMVGVPGAGKTQFAEKFAEMVAAPLLCHHDLQLLSDDASNIQEVMFKLMEEIIKTNQTFVFDGSLERRMDRDELLAFAKKRGYSVLFIWVQASQNSARKRIAKYAPAEVYDELVKNFSPPHESEPYTVISGHHTYTTQARAVLKRLTEDRAKALSLQSRPLSKPRRAR